MIPENLNFVEFKLVLRCVAKKDSSRNFDLLFLFSLYMLIFISVIK